MSEEMKAALWLTGAAVGIALLIPWARTSLGWMLGNLLTPASLAILKNLLLWMLWGVKMLFRAHLIWLKNLVLPRSVIYKSLAPRDDEQAGV